VRPALRATAAGLLGALASLAVVLQGAGWWGLLLAYAAVLSTTFAIPPGWSSRLPFGLAYVGVLVVALQPRPEGDFLVSADTPGYAVLALGFVVVLLTVATLPRPRAFGLGGPTTQNGARESSQ
jgi:hypothetical protein